MERQEISLEQLEMMAAAMAQALPDLECPECCECTWVYHYIERSAVLYQEEHDWACLFQALLRYRALRCPLQSGQSGGAPPR